MTWAAAKAACEGLGKTLAVPIDVIENSAVYTNWNGNNFGYWIGVTDAAVDGTWLDIGGNAISYNNFAEGKPDGATAKNCVVTGLGETWADEDCTLARQYICQGNFLVKKLDF